MNTDATFMDEKLWLRFRRWTWVRIAFVGLAAAAAFGFWVDDQQDHTLARELKQEQIQDDYEGCVRGNDVRQVVRDIVEVADEGGVSFNDVPSFHQVDAETRIFLLELENRSKSDSSFKDRAFENLPIRNCEKEYPEART